MHYNGFPAAEINGAAGPGTVRGNPKRRLLTVLNQEPAERDAIRMDGTDVPANLGRKHDGVHFPLSVLLVYWCCGAIRKLVAAARSDSDCAYDAAVRDAGVWLMNGDNNVFTRISLIVLLGLACKNAILIVEFAGEAARVVTSGFEAVLEALPSALAADFDDIPRRSRAYARGRGGWASSGAGIGNGGRSMDVAVFFECSDVTFFGLSADAGVLRVVQRLVEGKEVKTITQARKAWPAGKGGGVIHAEKSMRYRKSVAPFRLLGGRTTRAHPAEVKLHQASHRRWHREIRWKVVGTI